MSPLRSLRALLLAVSLAGSQFAAQPAALGLGVAAIVLDSGAAEARSRSSGGYSLPAVRTPSTGLGRSGGFGGSGGYGRPSFGYGSPSDSMLSGRASRDALDAYRRRQAAPVPQRTPDVDPYGTSRTYNRRGYDGYGGYGGYGVPRGYGGWSPPAWGLGGRGSFGIWDALFMWFMLDTLNRPGHAQFFHNHQTDPGYQDWRAEAERRAQDDPELRAKLADLDRTLAEKQGEPRDPNYLPPGVDPENALAGDRRTSAPQPSGGLGFGPIVVLLVVGGVLVVLWRARRRRVDGGLGAPSGTARVSESGPSPFRPGMVLDVDPAPFLLAAGATKVPPPPSDGGRVRASAAAVGRLEGGIVLHRAYLDDRHLFQVHLGAGGEADEARYFAEIDRVTPQSQDEWSFWLDPDQGQIGWPQFQTKDGKLYDRVWGGGDARVEPQAFIEALSTTGGTRTVRHQMMLYGATTGAADPAPQVEYVLVDAVETDGNAHVSILAGIDVNPAGLSLT
jgi:hypothetical protein